MEPVTVYPHDCVRLSLRREPQGPNMSGHLYLKHQQMHGIGPKYLTESFGLCSSMWGRSYLLIFAYR